MDPRNVVLHRLNRLSHGLSRTASRIGGADKPHHLAIQKKALLRHVHKLNAIFDYWAANYQPTRRRPCIHPPTESNYWAQKIRPWLR